jgi:predicted cobalt transporter CbtA
MEQVCAHHRLYDVCTDNLKGVRGLGFRARPWLTTLCKVFVNVPVCAGSQQPSQHSSPTAAAAASSG